MKLAAGQLGIPDAANKLYELMNNACKKITLRFWHKLEALHIYIGYSVWVRLFMEQ